MNEERDEQLGEALGRQVPTPEHRDDFFERLESRVESTNPERRVPAYVFPGIAVAAVVVALAVVAIPRVGDTEADNVALPPVSTTVAPGPATTAVDLPITLASQLGERVQRAFSSSTGIRATVTTTFAGGTEQPTTESFGWSANGDAYSSGPTGKRAYRANTMTYEENLEAGGYSSFTGDPFTYGLASVLPEGYITLRDTALALIDSDAAVAQTTWNDEAAYAVTVPSNVDGIGGGEALVTSARVTVLESSGLPVEIAYVDSLGRASRTTTVSDLDSNPTFTDADFTLASPTTGTTSRSKGPWSPTSEAASANLVPYSLLLPNSPPDGYVLTQTYFADSIEEFMQERSATSFLAVYRAGLLSVDVQYRVNAGEDLSGSGTRDPFFNFEGVGKRYDVAIRQGVYAGMTAHVVLEDIGEPYLWLANGDVILTVTGNVTPDELVNTVNSIPDPRAGASAPR